MNLETFSDNLNPVYITEGGITSIPSNILREIVLTLGYDPNSKCSGPDGKSDHTTISGLERTAFAKLGTDVLEWEQKLSARESGYDNQELGRKVFSCFRPLLCTKMSLLGSEAIMDALKVFEQDKDLSFSVYGPFSASLTKKMPDDSEYLEFNERLFCGKKLHYAFVFNTANIERKDVHFFGNHWVVLYVDVPKNRIDYFDSLGRLPSKDLKNSFHVVVHFLNKKHPELKLVINYTKVVKQRGGRECAVYVVHFVVERLFGKSFREFNKMFLPDDEISKYRRLYWTPADEYLFEH